MAYEETNLVGETMPPSGCLDVVVARGMPNAVFVLLVIGGADGRSHLLASPANVNDVMEMLARCRDMAWPPESN